MNDCEFYQELISCMADGELSARDRIVLAPHLERCPDCAALYAAFQSISGAIAEDMEQPPQSLTPNVMAELRRADIKAKNRKKLRWKGPLATAACLAVVVAAACLVPNLFRAGSAAPAAMSAYDQTAQMREYDEVSSSEEAASTECSTESKASPAEAAPEAEAFSFEGQDAGDTSETAEPGPAAFFKAAGGVLSGEYIELSGEDAVPFAALLSGEEAPLPEGEADKAYTVCWELEGVRHCVYLRIYGEQVFFSSDNVSYCLSSSKKAAFEALFFLNNP